MRRPYFIAESAQVTVLRSLASTSFGKVNLTLPEGVDEEDIFTPSAPGNELGYVAALNSGRRVGGMCRRFVRADVDITAKGHDNPTSNVERVLDEAAERTSGEFFLESDITLAGLGTWVPFRDFQVGDTADVEIWGMVVAMRVTRIEPVVSEHSIVDWLVHVGGQLVSDADALLAANEEIHRALVDDRRELAGLSGRVASAQASADSAGVAAAEADSKAVVAQEKADDVGGETQHLRDVLSGGGSTPTDVSGQLRELNRQLQRHGESASEGLIPAYIEANTRRWELQAEIDRAQGEVQRANSMALQAQRDVLAAKEREDRMRPLMAVAHLAQWLGGKPHITPDGRFQLEAINAERGVKIKALGKWEGLLVFFYSNMRALGGDAGTEIRLNVAVADGEREWDYVPTNLVGVNRVVIMTMPNSIISGG